MSEPRTWSVRVYGFDGDLYDPVVDAPTAGAARYAGFKAIREAGYFGGRDGFARYLVNVRVRPASDREAAYAPRLRATHPKTEDRTDGR